MHLPDDYACSTFPEGVELMARSKDSVELGIAAGRHEILFPLTEEPPVAGVALYDKALAKPRLMTPTMGSHATAWLARTDGMSDGLAQAEVSYAAPMGSRLILTSGPHRREWVAPGGHGVERFRWVLLPGELPLVLIHEHGLDPRARVESIRFLDIECTSKLVPADVDRVSGAIKIEAEKLASHRGPSQATRFGKYVCSGGILYGIGDLVTRVEYVVRVPKAGAYSIVFKHASDRARTAIGMEVNGKEPHPAAGLFLFQRTGGWGYKTGQWRTQRLCEEDARPVVFELSAGENRLVLTGLGGRMHLDWIALTPAADGR